MGFRLPISGAKGSQKSQGEIGSISRSRIVSELDHILKSHTTARIAKILLLVLEFSILVLGIVIYSKVTTDPLCKVSDDNWITKGHYQGFIPRYNISWVNVTKYVNEKRQQRFPNGYERIDKLIMYHIALRLLAMFGIYDVIISVFVKGNLALCKKVATALFGCLFVSIYIFIGIFIMERPNFDLVFMLWTHLTSDYKYLVTPCPVYPFYYCLGVMIITASTIGWGLVLALDLYRQIKGSTIALANTTVQRKGGIV